MLHHIRRLDQRAPALKSFVWPWFTIALASLLATSTRAASPRVLITNAPGFTITWDGNNGGFSNPNEGAGPSNNVAMAANGAVPFASSEYGVVHYIPNLNDGLYGNIHSWLASPSDAEPFCGVAFPDTVLITNIAWSRDNGLLSGDSCGGTCMDRNVGTYTLQYTLVLAADATTAETDDPATGWAPIGTITYAPGGDNVTFTGYLRHRFDIKKGGAAFEAAAIRFKVVANDIAIDEIEVNPIPDLAPPLSSFVEITPAPGFQLAWNRNEGSYSTADSPAPVPVNDASTNRGAVAFGSSQLDFGVHYIRNVNDGLYGNAHSWIADFSANPDPNPMIGINFGRKIQLRSIAWGRDNGDVAGDCCGGTLKDRVAGVYTIQYTTAANPGLTTQEACGSNPGSGWITLGTVDFKSDFPGYFTGYLRHRFDISQNNLPVLATAIRIKVPNNNIAIDEIEVNPLDTVMVITNTPGIKLTWNGNNGEFYDAADGAAAPNNIAWADNGSIAIGSSELAYQGIKHFISDINDGLYGNEQSWISANDPDPWIGVVFPASVTITNIAWGRDNGNATATDPGCTDYTCTDRTLGTYTLQYTQVSTPDATTPETGDAATGWTTFGSVTYLGEMPSIFTSYYRHRFDIASTTPLDATAVRIKISAGNIDLDELEINTAVDGPTPPPTPDPVETTPADGYTLQWDGNNGQFFDAAPGAAPPANRALASQGSVGIGSSELGETLGLAYHRWVNINDGLYGNSFSWISANGVGGTSDPDPWIGINFSGTVGVTNIAWGRDNGDDAEFKGTDRNLGIYTLQYTTLPSPDASTTETDDPATGWVSVGTIQYRRSSPPEFTSYLRHRFDVAKAGAPIEAAAIRLKVPDGNTAIDEIEVNTAAGLPAPALTITRTGDQVVVSWTGGGNLQSADNVKGPWSCVMNATSPYTLTAPAGSVLLYRVVQ